MANVCLIYPRDINLSFFPLGLGSVAAFLKENGHNVTFLDIEEAELGILQELRNRNLDIIGLSITTPQIGIAKKIIHILREIRPDVPIMAGGIHPSYFKKDFIRDHNVDFVIYGEGEITTNELCNAITSNEKDYSSINGLVYRNDNDIIINEPRKLIDNLDALPFPSRELVNFDAYLRPPGLIRGIWTERSTNITTSRGCPGRCTYCGVNYLWGMNYRRRSVESVLSEIDLLVNEYKVDGLYFMDDTFLMNKGWIAEFAQKYKERGYKLKLSCYGRVDTVNPDILIAIKELGFTQVEYGIESCSNKVLKLIKKNITVDQIKHTVKMTSDCGMRVLGSFIFGFPEDNEEDLKETINIASDLKLDFVTCYYATPYPGSELYEQAISENRIVEKDMSKWYVRTNSIWKVDLSDDIVYNYRQLFLKKFRFTNLMYIVKSPHFLLKLGLFLIKNYDALFRAIVKSVNHRCFDDFVFYFYTYLSSNLVKRNVL
jgi:anaerobic magnesium-protoporphyrin IX monomethyl ester cyclase